MVDGWLGENEAGLIENEDAGPGVAVAVTCYTCLTYLYFVLRTS